ncbi:MAG TPA: pyrimidine 5'-nucleotidase [Bauldia sp.]|nr:pyrimidine 5'-nucleotidase [Bauldia sp.]
MTVPSVPRVVGGERRDLSRFAVVDAWVFDLDNTLYPRHTNLFDQVDRRIRDYVERLLAVPPEEAHRIQKDYYRRYGTTLRGLMVEHGIRPDDFLEYVHDIDHSPVEADPALAAAIAGLPGRKFILTNGSRAHAEKIAGRLGITGHFDDIFDIVRAELLPKPAAETYGRFVAETGVDPKRAAMFEDLARNLVVPAGLGMATVLVVPNGTREVFHDDWEIEGHEGGLHADFLTDDLGAFLQQVGAALAGG